MGIPPDHARKLERLIRHRSGIVQTHRMVYILPRSASVFCSPSPILCPSFHIRFRHVIVPTYCTQGFRVVNNSFLASELVSWLAKNCGFDSRVEALELGQLLLDVCPH